MIKMRGRKEILRLSLWCIMTVSTAMSFLSCSIGDGDALSHLTIDDPLFLATGTGGNCYASMDGIFWQYVGTTSNDNFASTYNNGRYFLGGRTGGNIYAAASIDLMNWQGGTTGTAGAVNGILFHHNQAVLAVADNNQGIYRYRDGTITQDLLTGGNSMYCLASGNGLLVAGGGSGNVYTSLDGSTWTQAGGISSTYSIYGAVYARGLFVLTGYEGGGANKALITVSARGTHDYTANCYSGTVNDAIRRIAYGNGRFVAVGGINQIWCSDDGYLWINLQIPGLWVGTITDITYGNGLYVLVTSSGNIYCSGDGIFWQLTFSGGTSLYTVTCRP